MYVFTWAYNINIYRLLLALQKLWVCCIYKHKPFWKNCWKLNKEKKKTNKQNKNKNEKLQLKNKKITSCKSLVLFLVLVVMLLLFYSFLFTFYVYWFELIIADGLFELILIHCYFVVLLVSRLVLFTCVFSGVLL